MKKTSGLTKINGRTKNAITIKYVPLDKIKPWGKNPKKHDKEQIRALYENWKEQSEMKDVKHRPERLFFVHAILLLARAKKSRIVDNALIAFYGSTRPKPAIPDYAYDKHTVVGRKKGRGWDHFFTEGVKLENQAPIEDRYFERAKKVAMAGMVDNFGDAIDHDENLNVPVRGTQKRMF